MGISAFMLEGFHPAIASTLLGQTTSTLLGQTRRVARIDPALRRNDRNRRSRSRF
jgi:hypothetical protein